MSAVPARFTESPPPLSPSPPSDAPLADPTPTGPPITEFQEVVIEVTPVPIPDSELGRPCSAGCPRPLQPLDDLVNGKDAGFLTRIFSTKGWTRHTVKKDGEIEKATYRGRKIPVSEIDDLFLRLNLARVSTLRLDFVPELPSFPQHLFETLYIPGLKVLHFEQPLPLSAVPAMAAFVRGDPGRHLECITINRLRLDEEGVRSIIEVLLQAGVRYIGYNFEKGGPGLEIDLDPGRRHSRRSSASSVIEVRRLSREEDRRLSRDEDRRSSRDSLRRSTIDSQRRSTIDSRPRSTIDSGSGAIFA